jgi:hypothetical protein
LLGKKNLKKIPKKNVMKMRGLRRCVFLFRWRGIRVSALATLFALTSGWGNEGLGYF